LLFDAHGVGFAQSAGGHGSPFTVVMGRFASAINLGLAGIIGEDRGLRVVGNELDEGALEMAVVQQAPHVAILDESCASDVARLGRLKATQPKTGLVVLAHRPTRAYGIRLLARGATACVSKDAAARDILTAIHLAAEGKHMLDVTEDAPTQKHAPTELVPLTRREREVLELLRSGQSNAEIACKLHVSLETVRTHAAHIYRKLGVGRRGELITD
jgi:DNA-binding NarL/FixJ family response regulator